MTTPGDWLPPPPWAGPPLPGWIVRQRPSPEAVEKPAAPLEVAKDPPDRKAPARLPPQGLGDYVLVLKRRGPDPTPWAKPQHDRIRQANKAAAEQTRHLKGAERVLAMNAIVAREVARIRREEAAGA